MIFHTTHAHTHTHTKADIFIFLSFMNYIGSMKSYVKSNFHNNMDHHHEKYIKEYTIFLSTGSNVTHPRYVNVSVGGEFRTIHSFKHAQNITYDDPRYVIVSTF